MSTRSIVARVLDRPGSLERVVGLLRRRGLAEHRLSVGREGDDAWHVVIEVIGDDRLGERIRAELESLVDVAAVRTAAPTEEGREMVLAGIRPEAPPPDTPSEDVHLITGSSVEVDRALERLRRSGKLRWSVRTGAVVPFPPSPATGPGSSTDNDNQR